MQLGKLEYAMAQGRDDRRIHKMKQNPMSDKDLRHQTNHYEWLAHGIDFPISHS